MNNKYVTLRESDKSPHVMHLSLHNEKRLNAFDLEMLDDLNLAIQTIYDLTDVRVVIIESHSERAFSTGINTSYVNSLSNEEAAHFFTKLAVIFDQIEKLPCITIAAVNGYAYGAGGDLALACDIRIGKNQTKLRFPGPQFGLILGTTRLINEIGAARARYVTLTNKQIKSDEALEYGLLHDICEKKDLLEFITEVAINLCHLPKYSVKVIKHLTASNQEKDNIIKLTTESVLANDFKSQFTDFIQSRKKE